MTSGVGQHLRLYRDWRLRPDKQSDLLVALVGHLMCATAIATFMQVRGSLDSWRRSTPWRANLIQVKIIRMDIANRKVKLWRQDTCGKATFS